MSRSETLETPIPVPESAEPLTEPLTPPGDGHVFLSAVCPIYNEQESLRRLYERLTKVLTALNVPYEIILVNDGSRDQSWEMIRELCEADPRVKGIELSRNFGHQIALTCGLDHARGEVVAMMDADLQDPPELLPRMLEKYREGYDVVYAVRAARRGESLFKRMTAAGFYRLLRFCTAISIPLDTGDFRIIDRRALDSVLSLRERNRFLRGLFTWVGFRQTGVRYVRPARYAGETKYPLKKMVRFAIDGITSFSTVPLQASIWMGFLSAFLGFLYAIRVLVTWAQGGTVPGWASTTLVTLFFGGVQLICLGLLGEYIGRIFEEVKGRPLYFVREGLNVEDNREEAASHRRSAIRAPKEQGRAPRA